MGYRICEETGCVILYLELKQLENITEMVREVACTEENCDGRDGQFILDELVECLDGATASSSW